MESKKIIVKPESLNLWWGIYGFCEKIGWEDLNLFYDNEERIGRVCLNTKAYLKAGINDLKKYPEEIKFVNAIEEFLTDNKCHYWYYYSEIGDNDFYEVPYNAPTNNKGIKPRFIDIWHPDEGIGISTIQSAIKEFAKKFLGIQNCEVEIQNIEPFEQSLQSFKEHEELFGGSSPVEIVFSNELIEELSKLLNEPEENVRKRLNEAV